MEVEITGFNGYYSKEPDVHQGDDQLGTSQSEDKIGPESFEMNELIKNIGKLTVEGISESTKVGLSEQWLQEA